MGLWCRHSNQTWPRKDDEGEYCRCLDCGHRIPWSWGNTSTKRRPHQSRQATQRTRAVVFDIGH